jgi:uncharacterized surface protein with fasciclin (FAS1) repeats
MKKRVQLIPIAVVLVVLLFGVFGCSKNQDRYEDPPWLGGSSIETLEKRGDYTIFLQLMDAAEYTIPISKQLFTLFVPNDAAFTQYFQSAGISSVADLSKDQARELFTLHVLPNPRSRTQLIYEYMWNELQDPNKEYGSMFFRKPTLSTTIPFLENVKYYGPFKGQNLLMKTENKMVPLFTSDYFGDTFMSPDGSDYLFMYPGSKWETGHGDMNWGNAMVTESEVRTSSGFIYFIDQVVPPQKSIDLYMQENPDKFGLYYDLMQRFARYAPAGVDPQKRVLYSKNYDLVSNIADDRGPQTGAEQSMLRMYSAYLPSNTVLQKYLDENLLNKYESIDSVPRVTLFYLLQTQLSVSMGSISQISRTYFNAFGDQTVINKSDIVSAKMCSNGIVYEMNKVLEPNVFTTVPGDLFFDADYSTLLYALNLSSSLTGLANPNEDVTLFASTNEAIENYNIRYNGTGASPAMEVRGKDKVWRRMNTTTDLPMFVKDQIFNGNFPDLSGEGFVEMASKNFVYYSNNRIQGAENQQLNEFVTIDKVIPNDRNGTLYNMNMPIKTKWIVGQMLMNDPEVSQFKDYLIWTTLLNDRALDPVTKDLMPDLKFFAEADYWTAFIPTNEAMDKARAEGIINWPTTRAEFAKLSKEDLAAVKEFIYYHFVRKSTIFDDGKLEGAFTTNRVDTVTATGTVYSTINISNTKNALSIQDHSGNVVAVDHAKANILVRKGVAHKINTVLKY